MESLQNFQQLKMKICIINLRVFKSMDKELIEF
jgi:hypothetical protein